MDDFQMTLPRDHLRLRFTETIAWCSLKPLERSPEETEEIRHRRQLTAKASAILRNTYQGDSKSWFNWLTKRKTKHLHDEAFRLLREADPDSIEPLKDQLRTPALKPSGKFDSPQTEEERVALVERVGKGRAVLLRQSVEGADSKKINLVNGKILLYAPDDNLCDGAAKYASKGFFDIDNVPPWDSWVCFAGRFLVSWVPPVLYELARGGIEVNPEECIQWADEPFVEQLFGRFN